MSNYPNGFTGGVLLRNRPVHDAPPGKVFWVGNNATLLRGEKAAIDDNANEQGGQFLRPFATLDYAVGQCVANRGDIIYVRPNHTVTVSAADAVDFDVAGISVIGLGNGSNRPRLDYTDGAGECAVGADNVTLENLNFHANVDSVLIALDIEDGVDHCVIRNCLFDNETDGTDEFDNAIRLTNNNNHCLIEDCVMEAGLGDAVRAIFLDADTDHLIIRNNVIRGDYSTANIGGDTTASTEILIEGNLLVNGETDNIGTVECIELLTGTTGIIRDNDLMCNVATPDLAIVADTCMLFNNRYNETVTRDAVSAALPVTANFPALPSTGMRAYEQTGVVLTGGDVADTATVNNGAVLIHMIALEITTAVSANACLIHFESDPTRGASNTDLAEGTLAPDLTGAAIGDWFGHSGGSQDVMIKYANGTDLPEVASAVSAGVICPEGGIDLKLSTSDPTTGAGTLHILYSPLTPDAYIS